MKTSKRKYYYYERSVNPENGDIVMGALAPDLYDARWHRKNRIKQLKHTIARLTQENAKLKTLLGTNISAIVNAELSEEARAALAFAQQHMRLCHMKDPAPEVMHDEDGKICLRVHRNPVVITWDNKPIGPVADWYKNVQH